MSVEDLSTCFLLVRAPVDSTSSVEEGTILEWLVVFNRPVGDTSDPFVNSLRIFCWLWALCSEGLFYSTNARNWLFWPLRK